jgi:ABC-type dipeptide/oligopeptide/nickel transport system permease subunit
MSTTAARSPRALAWARRGNALKQFWDEFRHSPSGMIGLVFLLVVVVLAILAPVIAPSRMLDVSQLTDQPKFAPPSAEHLLGTDHQGREIWVRMLWGAQVSLIVGFCATIMSMVIGTVMPLVLANTTLTVGSAIISESTLSFLGLGDTTKQSWGGILKNAMDYSAATAGYWWYVLVPGIAIVLVVLAFTMVGRAVESIVNPTLRSR